MLPTCTTYSIPILLNFSKYFSSFISALHCTEPFSRWFVLYFRLCILPQRANLPLEGKKWVKWILSKGDVSPINGIITIIMRVTNNNELHVVLCSRPTGLNMLYCTEIKPTSSHYNVIGIITLPCNTGSCAYKTSTVPSHHHWKSNHQIIT